MACSSPVRTLTLARKEPVWSTGGTNPGESDIFVMSSEGIIQVAPLLDRLRVTMTVENATTDFQCRVVLQATDDGCAWDPAVNIEATNPTKSGNGTWTSSWYMDPSNFKRGIRFGVIASQGGTSTRVEQGRVTLTLDIQLKS